jgi:hypothetical protein
MFRCRAALRAMNRRVYRLPQVPAGKSVDVASSACASKPASRLRSRRWCSPGPAIHHGSGAGSTSTLSMMRAAIRAGSLGGQSVLGIEHAHETVSRCLVVDRHRLRHLGAAVAEFGTRATGLDDRHADAEWSDLLGDRLDEALDAEFRGMVHRVAGKCDLTSKAAASSVQQGYPSN